MNLNTIVTCLALVVTASACGLKSVGELEETSGTEGGTEDDTETGESMSSTGITTVGTSNETSASSVGTSDTEDSETGVSITTDAETGGTETGMDTDIGCPPGMSACDPQPQFGPEAAQWSVDGGGFNEVNLDDISCIVAQFVDDGTTLAITLECDEGELSQHTVVTPHNPITPLNIGQDSAVRLTYRADPIFWINEWFSIRANDGRFIIGGVQGSELLHPELTDLFAPVEVTLADPLCGPDCVALPCQRNQREAIDVVVDEASAQILDGNSGVVGPTTQYTFVVGEATSGQVLECDDVPESWYAIIAYDSSEG